MFRNLNCGAVSVPADFAQAIEYAKLGDFGGMPSGSSARLRGRSLEEIEREHVLSVLEETGWRVSGERGAAKILGLKRTTLEARMKKLGVVRPS